MVKRLTEIVSEDENYSKYRSIVKVGIERPTIPFLGVILHDLYYIRAVLKKEGVDDLANDKRILETLNILKYFQSGPNYNDIAKPEIKGNGLVPELAETLEVLSLLSIKEIEILFIHWIVTQPQRLQKELDELSQIREPRSVEDMQLPGISKPEEAEKDIDFKYSKQYILSEGLPPFKDDPEIANFSLPQTPETAGQQLMRSAVRSPTRISSGKSPYAIFFKTYENANTNENTNDDIQIKVDETRFSDGALNSEQTTSLKFIGTLTYYIAH
jgi:hypothetical protein